MDVTLGRPETPEQFERYFDFRWRLLREPWDQPRGTERDEREESAHHVTAHDADGRLIGVGRVHMNDEHEAQIRYMATDENYRRRGIGRAIAQRLEDVARSWGAERIVLNARHEAVDFYLTLGYSVAGPGPTKFGSLAHSKLEKSLSDPAT